MLASQDRFDQNQPMYCRINVKEVRQNMFKLTPVFILLLSLSPLAYSSDDILIADFEDDSYGSWKVKGEAFGTAPARGTLKGQMTVSEFKGRGLVNSFLGGDDNSGTLTSPEFKIERKYISFLIGGGKNPEKLAMNLLIDGMPVRNATGPNDKPGGSEALAPDYWDVTDLAGKSAVIQIIDNATGGWGHINIDHIVQTDKKPPGILLNPRRELLISNRFVNFPIKTGAPKRVVRIIENGRLIVRNDMELAVNQAPDWWAPMDVSAYAGKNLTVEVDKLPEDSKTLALIDQSDVIKGSQSLYREPLRGQFHFSPRRGWNNDPNGLVYFNGEYHLFFQHNPYGWSWGNMHWGHAVSRDLVHWRELGDKLLPDELGPMFSGSAVVDWQNTSGLGQPGKPPLVLFYTAAGNPTVQCMAWSLDGRNFTKYNANPIIRQITGGNRDPKVIWHEQTKKWVMTLYVEVNKIHTIHFFTSTDLKNWEKTSTIDGFYECPDFFELPVDGNPANKKWVLTAANSEYMVGSFDGKTFKPETPKLTGQRGRGFYAAQTFSDIPSIDGRRIQIGWFQTATPGMAFNQSMTIPLELKLISTAEGPRLTWTPVKELDSLVSLRKSIAPISLKPGDANPLAGYKAELARIDLDFVPGENMVLVMKLRGTELIYDSAANQLKVNNQIAKAQMLEGVRKFTVLVDRTGLEIFADNGLTYIPIPVAAKSDDLSYSLEARGGSAKIQSLTFSEMESAWLDEGHINEIQFDYSILSKATESLKKEASGGRVVGAAHLVVQNGKPIYNEVVGLADSDDNSPFKPDSIVRIYSMSKALTSVAAMTLFEKGKFQLDDPVEKYIPELAKRKVLVAAGDRFKELPASRPITVRDLFRHTSGYSYGAEPQYGDSFARLGLKYGPPMGMYPPPISLEKAARAWATLPLVTQPGERFLYGLNTDLLGRLIEIWSGMTLDKYMQEAVCKPLEMIDTGFSVPESKRSRLVSVHTIRDGKPFVVDKGVTSGFQKGFGFLSGGGGMVSTMNDYANFCQMLVDGGKFKGKQILSPDSIDEMFTNQLKDAKGPMKFGLGFAIADVTLGMGNDQQLARSYNWAGYATTDFRLYPGQRMFQIFMRQHLPSDYGFNRSQMNLIESAVQIKP